MPIDDLQMSTVLPNKLCLNRLRLDSFADGFRPNESHIDRSVSIPKNLSGSPPVQGAKDVKRTW
jgi:hypothetical protein